MPKICNVWSTKFDSWNENKCYLNRKICTKFILSQDITFRNSVGPNLIVRKRESQRPRQASKSKPPPLHSPSLHDRCLNQFSMSQFESSQCQTLLREFLARLCAEQWYSLVCDWKWGCRTAEHLWPQITWTTSMRPFHQGHQQILYFGFLPNLSALRLSTCLFWIFAQI